MVRLYADELLRGVNRLEAGVSVLANKLDTEDLATVVTYFNKVFNAIDYNRYPIENEASCRSHLQVLLMGGAMVPDVEKHTALGRSDLEVRTANRLWVFEIKFAKCTREVEPLLAQAVTQIQNGVMGSISTLSKSFVQPWYSTLQAVNSMLLKKPPNCPSPRYLDAVSPIVHREARTRRHLLRKPPLLQGGRPEGLRRVSWR